MRVPAAGLRLAPALGAEPASGDGHGRRARRSRESLGRHGGTGGGDQQGPDGRCGRKIRHRSRSRADACILDAGVRDGRSACRKPDAHRRDAERRLQDDRKRGRGNRLRQPTAGGRDGHGEPCEDGRHGEGAGGVVRPGAARTSGGRFGHLVRRNPGSGNGHRNPGCELPYAEQLAALCGGRIPDRGLFERGGQHGGHSLADGAERRFGGRHLRSARRQRRHHHHDQERQLLVEDRHQPEYVFRRATDYQTV